MNIDVDKIQLNYILRFIILIPIIDDKDFW